MKAAKLLVAIGVGILAIWAIAWPLNVFGYHRAAWFYTQSLTFLLCGAIALTVGSALALILRRRALK